MITHVLAGLFRQGTTIIWYITKLSNPDKLHLYEPCHPELFESLKNWVKGMKDRMHGLPLWDDYLDIPDEFITLMRNKHPYKNAIIRFEEVKPYLNVINEIMSKIVIQPCRLNFVLKDIKLCYNCVTIAILRNPVDTYLSHFTADVLMNEDKVMKFSLEKTDGDPFFTNEIYRELAEIYDFPMNANNLEQFAVVWTLANYNAIIGADHVIVYEKLCMYPYGYLRQLNNTVTGLNFDPIHGDLINPYRAFKSVHYRNSILKEIESTVSDYGLDRFYDRVMKEGGFYEIY